MRGVDERMVGAAVASFRSARNRAVEVAPGHFLAAFIVDVCACGGSRGVWVDDIERAIEERLEAEGLASAVAVHVQPLDESNVESCEMCCPLLWWCVFLRSAYVRVAFCAP